MAAIVGYILSSAAPARGSQPRERGRTTATPAEVAQCCGGVEREWQAGRHPDIPDTTLTSARQLRQSGVRARACRSGRLAGTAGAQYFRTVKGRPACLLRDTSLPERSNSIAWQSSKLHASVWPLGSRVAKTTLGM